MRRFFFVYLFWILQQSLYAVGSSGMYQYSVALSGYISTETGKAPTAYLWIPDGCRNVKAVLFAQQNMTEEMLFKNPHFRAQLQKMDVALLWVAPWFSQNWDPATGCQKVFEEMMTAIAYQISADGQTVTLNTPKDVRVEVISGPLRKVSNTIFRVYPYECGLDNPKRSFTSWLIAIREGDNTYKRSVRPIEVKLPNPLLK